MNLTQETDALLAPARLVDPATMTRLHAALERTADAEGLLDVAYRTIETPVGMLLVAATEQGLVRVAYLQDGQDVLDGTNLPDSTNLHDSTGTVLDELAVRISPRILKSPARLDAVARQLDEYFSGARRQFDIALDFRLSKGFRRTVLGHLPSIGFGHTESYAQVAVAAGNPKAVRAVGSACATNPLPIVVPCHRVVRSDGSFGGYAGGPEAKRTLLNLEAA